MQGQEKGTAHPPYVITEARFLAVETETETYLFPYIGLRLARITEIDKRKVRSLIELHFDLGIVRIRATQARALVEEIQRERLFLIRKGIGEDLNSPQIEGVDVELQEELGTAKARGEEDA